MGKRILGIVGSYRQLFRTPCSARRMRLDISWLRALTRTRDVVALVATHVPLLSDNS